jgi:hypothetical protein
MDIPLEWHVTITMITSLDGAPIEATSAKEAVYNALKGTKAKNNNVYVYMKGEGGP